MPTKQLRDIWTAIWGARPAWLVAGLIVGAIGGAAFVVLRIDDDPPPPTPRPTAYSDVDAPVAFTLAKRFRPWLRFDSGEPWRPLDLRRLLSERPAHRLCLRDHGCDTIRDLDDFAQHVSDAGAFGDESYLDLEGSKPADFAAPNLAACGAEKPLQDCDSGPSSSIYYRVSYANERYYVDYWWFLRFNDNSPNKYDHEGDWEGVTVVTAPRSTTRLDYVSFASHEGRFRYAGPDLERGADRRPAVYIANGSHAAYAHPCDKPGPLCQQLVRYKRLVQIPERRFDGDAPWGRNSDGACFPASAEDACLRPLPRVDLSDPLRSWTVWTGLWGASCGGRCGHDLTDSPRSPGVQARYSAPWCSSGPRGQLCDSTPLGCEAWLGPLVAIAVCLPPEERERAAAEAQTTTLAPSVTIDGARKSYSATAGVLQVLGGPLTQDHDVRFAGITGPGVQILVRARARSGDGRVTEARFDGAELAHEPIELVIEERGSHPRLLLRPAGLEPVAPVSVRTFRPVRESAG